MELETVAIRQSCIPGPSKAMVITAASGDAAETDQAASASSSLAVAGELSSQDQLCSTVWGVFQAVLPSFDQLYLNQPQLISVACNYKP